MQAPFSEDLRWQVTRFVHVLKHSVAQASFVLGVSDRTVERYISKFLVTGDVKSGVIAGFHCHAIQNRSKSKSKPLNRQSPESGK